MLGRAGFDDDGVAVVDIGVDHGVAADAEGEGFRSTTTGAGRDGDLHRVEDAGGLGVVGETGGDGAGELHVFEGDGIVAGAFVADDGLRGVAEDFGDDLVGAGGTGDALEDAFALEGLEVTVDAVGGGEAELGLDIADARPVGVLSYMRFHVVEDGPLLLGQFFHSERMFDENLFTVKPTGQKAI